MFINPEKLKKNINFGEYLKQNLDEIINDLELGKKQTKKVDENIEKEVNETIESLAPKEVNEKQKSLISKHFTYIRENINNMQELKESSIEDFKKLWIIFLILNFPRDKKIQKH